MSVRFTPEQAGTQMTRRCPHCKNNLISIPVRRLALNSPFQSDKPAIVCKVCDAPGELPFRVRSDA